MTPSAFELLRRAPRGFAGYSMLIAFGVLASPCGIGVIAAMFGAIGLLRHAARTAGIEVREAHHELQVGQSFTSGLYTFLLAAALAGGGGFVFAALLTDGRQLGSLGVAMGLGALFVTGAALAPVAFAPVASMCGARGFHAPITEAIDRAGADDTVRLSLLTGLLGVALAAPIPIVMWLAFGSFTAPVLAPALCLAFLLWSVVIACSAATLTARYLRLSERDERPSTVGHAAGPLLVCTAIGVLSVALCSGVHFARTSDSMAHAPPPSRPTQAGPRVEVAQDTGWRSSPDDERTVPTTAIRIRRHGRGMIARGDGWAARLDERGPGACHAYGTPDGGVMIDCALHYGGGARYAWLGPGGERLHPTWWSHLVPGASILSPSALGLLLLAIALLVLGRRTRGLRLLSRRAFRHEGVLTDTDGQLHFATNDGAHRAQVPRAQVEHKGDAPAAGAATLVSDRALPAQGFRTAGEPIDAGALVLVGPLEEALGRRLLAARRLGLRFAIAVLGCLAVAAISALMGV